MTDCQLHLSPQEREYLGELLESELKETRVEGHRTRTISYREHIVEREDVIRGLLTKLTQADVAAAQSGV